MIYGIKSVSIPVCMSMLSISSSVQLFAILWTSPLGSSVHETLLARILEWVAMPSFEGSSWSRERSQVSSIPCAGRPVLYLGSPLIPVLLSNTVKHVL